MTKAQYEAYKLAVDRGLAGLEFVSTGTCPGCEECGLSVHWEIHGPPALLQEIPMQRRFDSEDEALTELEAIQADKDLTDLDTSKLHVVECEPSGHERELAEEPHFSWSACDCCGSRLGGDRHPAHGIIKLVGSPDLICHLNICTDCLYFINYGKLDDMSMLEIADDEARASQVETTGEERP